MNYWKQVTAKNSQTYNENLNGEVLVIKDSSIEKIPFKYASVTPRKYASISSALPGEFIEPTETIYTTAIDLPFTKSGQIIMDDRCAMTIRDIDRVLNANTGHLMAYTIYLDGGVPNEFA